MTIFRKGVYFRIFSREKAAFSAIDERQWCVCQSRDFYTKTSNGMPFRGKIFDWLFTSLCLRMRFKVSRDFIGGTFTDFFRRLRIYIVVCTPSVSYLGCYILYGNTFEVLTFRFFYYMQRKWRVVQVFCVFFLLKSVYGKVHEMIKRVDCFCRKGLCFKEPFKRVEKKQICVEYKKKL